LTHLRDFGFFALRNFKNAMANTKSAIKAARKSIRNAARNKTIKTRLKTLAKGVTAAAAAGDAEKTRAAAIAYSSALDKAVKSAVIHKNTASHHKSQVSKYIFVAKK